jgi:hypothetical protein
MVVSHTPGEKRDLPADQVTQRTNSLISAYNITCTTEIFWYIVGSIHLLHRTHSKGHLTTIYCYGRSGGMLARSKCFSSSIFLINCTLLAVTGSSQGRITLQQALKMNGASIT